MWIWSYIDNDSYQKQTLIINVTEVNSCETKVQTWTFVYECEQQLCYKGKNKRELVLNEMKPSEQLLCYKGNKQVWTYV